MGKLRELAAPFVVPGPAGVAIRDRLRVSESDAGVLAEVGDFLGSLAAGDLAERSQQGLEHNAASWAVRKRGLTGRSSARWAGSITKATHDQWALARRGQVTQMSWLRGQIASVEARLARPLGAKADKRAGLVRGYASRGEWHAKTRRLQTLKDRLAVVEAAWTAGRVRVVRGGKRLARTRHNLGAAGLSEQAWRECWRTERMFLAADGESGKRFGNETIRVTDTGQVSIKLPAALAHLANAPHGRYVLDVTVRFQHRGQEWRDRITANRAVAYRINHDTARGRWYVTASWQRAVTPTLPLEAALAHGVVGVDMNDDHLAAWQLDVHGNPVGEPQRFFYDLTGSTEHRDAQLRHALSRLLHYTRDRGSAAIAIEDLDFTDGTSREKYGRNKRFRRLLSRFPTAKLKARLVSMAAEQDITIVAVGPAYTSKWGAQHWQQPLTTPTRKISRHDAASIAVGRRALGHSIRRRTAPPHDDRSDRRGHRIVQARPEIRLREETRPHLPGPRTRCVSPVVERKRGTSLPNTVRGSATEQQSWQQDSLTLSVQERYGSWHVHQVGMGQSDGQGTV
ncbi:IS200/IS605 family accessory protein TnpB-related protein [Streptomyces sp. NPDC050982]|uniref:IS200/IS605 family accessory protein TnpB-related protein n=1 Tax=Streptomyces sp. NPDC050982 TaxID=3154746 RepID=UPI0033CAA1F9